ncbi:MAG: glycosyltransferase [Bacteroidales bacterium]|nr:glycosyltransferase [Bacteroidales bacterium]
MISIICLSYFSGERISVVFHNLSKLLIEHDIPFEFIVIDDGSTDNSFELAEKLASENPNVRAFQLSKNYTSHYGTFAGLSVCKGDCAMGVPDDEQQPYEIIIDLYKLWMAGHKVIIPYRLTRNDGFFNNLFANSYYKIINALSEVKFPPGGADSMFIDREVIDIINNRIHPINTSLMTEILRLGFSPFYYPFERAKSLNTKSRWTLKKKIRLFKDTFFSCSTWPIKMITRLGLVFAVVAFGLIVFYGYLAIFGNPHFWGERLPGWTSTVIILSFFSGLILFSLGIIAEYIWRIYEEVKNRPGYIIKKGNPGN